MAFQLFTQDLGIDLGTSNVLIYVDGKGVVIREPSVVAVDKNSGKILQVGAAARNMLGRTPGNVVAMHPRVVISVPSGITEVEERTVINAAAEAGARRVYLIEEPLAAALGAGLDLNSPTGHMVVDIGAGTTDIAVLSMNGVASSSSLKVAGDAFDEAIARHVRRRHGVVIGQTTAEDVKIQIGSVYPRNEDPTMIVKGRDSKNGVPRELMLSSSEVCEVLIRMGRQIADEVLSVLEDTSPELVGDISQTGITLTGGGSQIYGMDLLLTERTGVRCTLADDAPSCVVYGCGKSLAWINQMTEGPINVARKRLLNSK